MTPDLLHDFFSATATVAGGLIGLLFVAISVSSARLAETHATQGSRIRAQAAMTAFTNALVVSLFALLTRDIGTTALVVSILGVLFVSASLLSLMRVRRSHLPAVRDVVFLVGLLLTFAIQLRLSLEIMARPDDSDAAQNIGSLVIICCLIGIARSWELIGGPNIGIGSELWALVRREERPPSES